MKLIIISGKRQGGCRKTFSYFVLQHWSFQKCKNNQGKASTQL